MSKTFDSLNIPYCTKDFHPYFTSLLTPDEIFYLKQYFYYQKNLAVHLMKYQRLLLSKYNRQGIRFNYKLYIDKKTFENFGFSPIRSKPNLFIMNEKQFNRILNSLDIRRNHLQSIKPHKIQSQLKPDLPLILIHNIESHIKNIDTKIIKLNTCSTLIANGHGISKTISSSTNNDKKQLNHHTIYEDISLSKACQNILNRSLFRRLNNPKLFV
ncbi:unnamed protein product [Rotaria sp. Silwood2]|nr:unnamed protein product [Rotaria sp. Silwood2]CAF2766332.1 unnamed protein product [Rotaria sp. Silwood2]CAF2987154.1 unnamed protein product [Rotaria sp. Silwood2]CAF3920306.1 unnamed protein product [Rotaria sp. Silwood2]CAF3956211.1 unnamed protein product [Rotaria sp. Silwood2]